MKYAAIALALTLSLVILGGCLDENPPQGNEDLSGGEITGEIDSSWQGEGSVDAGTVIPEESASESEIEIEIDSSLIAEEELIIGEMY